MSPADGSAFDCSPSTSITLQGRCPVSLPHHRVLLTHGATAALLLCHVPIYVSHAHPASSGAGAGRRRTDSPLGVVLADTEGERLPRVDEFDVQDFPAQGAVGRENASGADPELDQEIGLEGGSHPAVVQV